MIRCKTRLESVPKKNYTLVIDQRFANNLILPILQELYEVSSTDPLIRTQKEFVLLINNNIR